MAIYSNRIPPQLDSLFISISISSVVIFVILTNAILKYNWKWIIRSFDDFSALYAFWNTFFSVVPYTVMSLFYMLIYLVKLPFFEQFRINPKPWPWEEKTKQWEEWLKKSMIYIFINMIVLNYVLSYHDAYTKGAQYFRFDYGSFPGLVEVFTHIGVCILAEDTAFYWAHRLFHHPKLYRFHQLHHQYTNSVAFCSVYAHPLEFIFANMLTTSLGYQILGKRMHYSTYFVWLIVRLIQTCQGHGGYDFPWSPFRILPFQGESDYHNYHHSHNDGNYGSFFQIWDTIMQTNKTYNVLNQKREEISNEQRRLRTLELQYKYQEKQNAILQQKYKQLSSEQQYDNAKLD